MRIIDRGRASGNGERENELPRGPSRSQKVDLMKEKQREREGEEEEQQRGTQTQHVGYIFKQGLTLTHT